MRPDPAPTGMRLKSSPVGPLPAGIEERFLEAGGVRFRYLIREGRASEAGSVSPFFFLHRYPTWAEVWLPLVDALGPRRPWIAPDLPDHNRSGRLPRNDRTISAYRRAITALFDALHLPKAIVVGSSLGGTLGVMLALDRPDRVERLVVLDAAGFTPTLPKKTVRLYVPFVLPSYVRAPRPRNVRRLLETAVFRDPRRIEEAWVQTIVEQWKPRPQRKAFIATGNALRGADATVAGDLERVRAPTLVVWGRQDPQFDWHIGEAAARRIPRGQFVAIEDCGHFPMVEKPTETAVAVSAFLGP